MNQESTTTVILFYLNHWGQSQSNLTRQMKRDTKRCYWILGIDIKLHPTVLPQLSPLGRSLKSWGTTWRNWVMGRWRWLDGDLGLSPLTRLKCPCSVAEVALSRHRQKCWRLDGCIAEFPMWITHRSMRYLDSGLRLKIFDLADNIYLL